MKILILLYLIAIIACNPVQKVLRDPKKFEQVKEAVIRSGACVNDTIRIETIKDSISYKDSIVENIVHVPCKDFDTTLLDGTRIIVSSGALTLSQNFKQKVTSKIIKVTETVRDTKLENYLRKDISNRDSLLTENKRLLDKSNEELKVSKTENTKLKWKLIGLIAISTLIIFRKTILKLAI